jgi:asparagine synthase (glutamine-hydrolysing)
MGRILGVIDWSAGGENAGALIETMHRIIPRRSGSDEVFRAITRGPVTLALASGDQVFEAGLCETGSGTYAISYNGYLPGLDAVFREHGVPAGLEPGASIIALYRKIGDDFLKIMPGMFMLALYDGERRRLLLAGGRNGYFPIYYASEPQRFLFASSLRPIRETCASTCVNTAAIVEHLAFDALYGSGTYYEAIKLLPFGSYCVVDLDTKRVEPGTYFRYEDLFDPAAYRANRNVDAPAELTKRLRNAVGRVFEGRDPALFGLSCGGGIDCSFVGGIITKDLGIEIPVFCTSVTDAAVSEGNMAKLTAERLGVELHVGSLTREMFYPGLVKAIVDFDEPIVHPNTAKFYTGIEEMHELGRRNMVYGVASDLLFGSFGDVRSYYRHLRVKKLFASLPRKARVVLAQAMGDASIVNLERRIRNPLPVLARAGLGNFERAAMQHHVETALAGIDDPSERALKTLMIENLCEYQQHLLNRRYELSSSRGLSYFFPFLDLEVVRFAMNLPVVFCVGWNASKIVVRKAALPYVGAVLAGRRKYGGDVPIEQWVRPLAFLLEDGILRDLIRFDRAAMGRLLDDSAKFLWNMIDLELWGRLCLLGTDPERLLDEIRAHGVRCSSIDSLFSS